MGSQDGITLTSELEEEDFSDTTSPLAIIYAAYEHEIYILETSTGSPTAQLSPDCS